MLNEIEEDIFFKTLLKKHRSKNSMKEIKTEKINPSKKKQKFFFEALAFEENYGGDAEALEKEEINDEKKERIFTLRDGVKIIYKYEKNTIDLNDTKAKFLKIEKYDNDIMAEYFYRYGLLKKIIYYNKDRSINNINYFDIYYSIDGPISYVSLDFLLEMNKYFEVKTLKEKDIKIYRDIDYKLYFLGNYPSNILDKKSEILKLKILKDNIEVDQKDIESFINNLKSFPTITEYYSNNKIIKKDIYKVERILKIFAEKICQISHKRILLIGKLEKTEYFNQNNEVEKVKKINKYIRLRNTFWDSYIPRIEYFYQENVPRLFVKENIKENIEENFVEQEENFLKGLLEKYRAENSKEKINLKEEIKELKEEYDEINLVKKEVDKRKEERIFTFKNGSKIIYKYESISIDDSEDLEDDWEDLEDDWGYFEDKLLKIEKYNKNGKIEIEYFYHHGFLKKIIYYDEDQTINNINYFDIYYNKESRSLSYIYSSFYFYNLDKYFETKSLKESDIKICVDTEYGSKFLGNYPSDMIKAEEESLILKTLKENIKIAREDTDRFINDFESFPTMTEYYRNGKIIKKDIFKVERIMEISDSEFFHTNVRLRGVLEKTEHYNKDNEIEKIEEINRNIYLTDPDSRGYLPRIKFQ